MLIMWCLRPNTGPYRISRRQTMLEKDKTDPPKTALGSPWASLGLPGPPKPPKVPTVAFIYTQYHPSTCCITCYHSQIGQFFTVIPKSVHQLQLEFFTLWCSLYCPQSFSGGGLYLNGSWLLWSVNDGLLGLCIMGYYGACIVGYYGVFMVGYYEANVVYGSYE